MRAFAASYAFLFFTLEEFDTGSGSTPKFWYAMPYLFNPLIIARCKMRVPWSTASRLRRRMGPRVDSAKMLRLFSASKLIKRRALLHKIS